MSHPLQAPIPFPLPPNAGNPQVGTPTRIKTKIPANTTPAESKFPHFWNAEEMGGEGEMYMRVEVRNRRRADRENWDEELGCGDASRRRRGEASDCEARVNEMSWDIQRSYSIDSFLTRIDKTSNNAPPAALATNVVNPIPKLPPKTPIATQFPQACCC